MCFLDFKQHAPVAREPRRGTNACFKLVNALHGQGNLDGFCIAIATFVTAAGALELGTRKRVSL